MHEEARPDSLSVFSTEKLFSFDVFDTILIRNISPEQSRLRRAEKMAFANAPQVTRSDWRRERRFLTQLAYRCANAANGRREVSQKSLLSDFGQILNLRGNEVENWNDAIVEVEKSSLRADKKIISLAKNFKDAGGSVIAISDTALSTDDLKSIIYSKIDHIFFDHIYSSADEQLTKRHGTIFESISENSHRDFMHWRHFGDDKVADVAKPSLLGITTELVKRPRLKAFFRRSLGAMEVLADMIKNQPNPFARHRAQNAHQFGFEVMGPIISEFSIRLWFLIRQFEKDESVKILFATRGGTGMHVAFDALIERFGLPLNSPRENLAISRLVCARAGIVDQRPSAFEEIQREFAGKTMEEVANILAAQSGIKLSDPSEKFSVSGLQALIRSEQGKDLNAYLHNQSLLLREYLNRKIDGAGTVILVDTGLYGSIHKMLQEILPSKKLFTVQIARSNYKRLSTRHFKDLFGLTWEGDAFHPLKNRSYVLRYWQLIEAIFEIGATSASHYARESEGGRIIPNTSDEVPTASAMSAILAGAVEYIKISPAESPMVLARQSGKAWRKFRNAVTRPSLLDVEILSQFERSFDFGSDQSASMVTDQKKMGLRSRLKLSKRQLWREGAFRKNHPIIGMMLARMFGIALWLRGMKKSVGRA